MSAPVNVNSLPSGKVDFLAKARQSWGADIPDWIEELAKYARRTSVADAARRLDRSASTVSQLISNNYRAKDVSKIEALVRGVMMQETVDCPEAGPIRRDRCLREQDMPLNASSPHRVAMYHACRSGCAHSRLKAEGGVDA
ncbi:MAG TPA: transcriptional regulator [Methylocystis sp.]|jgi:hypothetical protein